MDPMPPEEEPERHVPLRTPPPPKKPLDEFLREFEERLSASPSEPATGANQAIDERAQGSRRSPVESNPDRYAGAPRGAQHGAVRRIRRPPPTRPVAPSAPAPAAPSGVEPPEEP